MGSRKYRSNKPPQVTRVNASRIYIDIGNLLRDWCRTVICTNCNEIVTSLNVIVEIGKELVEIAV